MDKVKETVLRLHTGLMHDRGIDKESSPELEIRPKNGITSESIVVFILDLEDELDIELDEYLPQIRKAKTIENFIKIVEESYREQHN